MPIRVTKTDPNAQWAITDDVVRLREWGTETIHALPDPPTDVTVGSDPSCELRLDDPTRRTSRRHAKLVYDDGKWRLRDLRSKNGLRLDGAHRETFELEPGSEIGIGGLTLIAESGRSIALRGFLARILGWETERSETVDHALRAIRMAATRRAVLALCGEADLVAIAHSLHRIALGPDRPFVSCDPRRLETKESARAVENHPTGMQAIAAATGGTVCVLRSRLPPDFASVVSAVRSPEARVQLVVCSVKPGEIDVPGSAPIELPALASRAKELRRIIDEYAQDASAELGTPRGIAFPGADRNWVIEHASASLSEIEKATLRLVALRVCGNVNRAAARLGMAHVSLARWIGRRQLPMRIDHD
ncbi:MAG: FHA domain-containing protein [Deltaproteobacteria bacterium]|nr:FHA domain-containing protein [Deltaproteobacteria bacterium]